MGACDFTFTFLFSCTGEGNGNPLQYSCLGNPMDRGAWQATVHGVAKSWIGLSDVLSYLIGEKNLKMNGYMYMYN